jgi:hypothetical protein
LASGIYTIAPGGNAGRPTIQVFCDMDTAGGGWSLVARSATGGVAGSGFGWRAETGSLADDANAYSLNTTFLAEDFTEILIGDVATAKTWGDRIFQIAVPQGFVDGHESTDLTLSADGGLLGTVAGAGCSADAGFMGWPSHLTVLGGTAGTDGFRMADDGATTGTGLLPDGFSLQGPGCATSGDLHGAQGMIMVR